MMEKKYSYFTIRHVVSAGHKKVTRWVRVEVGGYCTYVEKRETPGANPPVIIDLYKIGNVMMLNPMLNELHPSTKTEFEMQLKTALNHIMKI